MRRSAALHPLSPCVPLVPWDASPLHSIPVPHQPCSLLLSPQHSKQASPPRWVHQCSGQGGRGGTPQSPPGCQLRDEALAGQALCPAALRWMDALSPLVKEQGPLETSTHACQSGGCPGPRKSQQMPPAPLTPSPCCHQPLPAWHALAQPCTDWGPACGSPVAPSPPPPDAMGAPSRSASLPQIGHRSLLQGLSPLQVWEACPCRDIFLYRPGALGQWGYFGCQVRYGAKAMAMAGRRLWVHGSQHPLCTEKCPLNSCVQLASCRHAYGASGFSPGISGEPTAACCAQHPPQASGTYPTGQAWLCVPKVPCNSDRGKPGGAPRTLQTRDAPRLTRRIDSGESAQLAPQQPWPLQREGCASTGMRVLLACKGTGGCEQRTEHWAQGKAGCWEQAVCSSAGKSKITLCRHEGSSGGGVWRVATMAGGSSSSIHIHRAPRESCISCWCHVVCGSHSASKGGSPTWGDFP